MMCLPQVHIIGRYIRFCLSVFQMYHCLVSLLPEGRFHQTRVIPTFDRESVKRLINVQNLGQKYMIVIQVGLVSPLLTKQVPY